MRGFEYAVYMPRIQLLSEETINQIAAGEVIENPASVVKELVENGLDAGATHIAIEIVEGGLKLIRVSDNGSGMGREDALLCIQRHATSKLQNFKDLFHLRTMGFRGEALAAISAISKMTMLTAVSGVGLKIQIDGGVIKSEKPAARAQGTTIEVSDLFFNVPARKKFQKGAVALSAEVLRVVTQLALSAPAVHFELISNRRKTLIALPAESHRERAEFLIGSEFTAGSYALDFKEGEMEAVGLLGNPSQAKPNRLGQFLFLNGRAVQCSAISYAIRDAYGTRIDDKRFPSYVLHLSLPPELIDVNVHPQKREVRLRDERVLRHKIQEVVDAAFKPQTPQVEAFNFTPPPFSFQEVATLPERAPFAPQELALESDLHILGLIGPFLIIEETKALKVVDLRLVRYRLCYDQLMERIHKVEQQGLLIPFAVDFTPLEAAMLLTHLSAVEELGFVIRPAGKELFLVEAMPAFLEMGDIKTLLSELCQLLQEFIGKAEIEEQRKRKLALATARFAKNRQSYSVEEGRELVRALATSKDPAHSPGGQPIAITLNLNELFSSRKSS